MALVPAQLRRLNAETAEYEPVTLRHYNPDIPGGPGVKWEKVTWHVDPNAPQATAGKSTEITYPPPGPIADAELLVTVEAHRATGVHVFLDGVELAETQRRDIHTWTIRQDVTSIVNGSHILTATADYLDGTALPAATPVTVEVLGGIPGGPGDPGTGVRLTSPNGALVMPRISGSTFKPVVEADVSVDHGAVTAVEVSWGNPPATGWWPCSMLSPGIYRMTGSINTDYFQSKENAGAGIDAALAARTRVNVHMEVHARATYADGAVIAAPTVVAHTANIPDENPPAGAWNHQPWAADTNGTLADFINSFYDPVARQWGQTYGKELGATSIRTDPVGTAGGHTSYGTVAWFAPPRDYAAQTAAMPASETFRKVKYGAQGDQPKSGALRCQYYAPRFMTEGDITYTGFAFFLPANFQTPINKHISVTQYFPGAANGHFEWSLAAMPLDQHKKLGERADAVANTFQWWAGELDPYRRKLYEAGVLRGTWIGVVQGIKHSETDGWYEWYIARPDVNGGRLTQHVFPDGTGRLVANTLPRVHDLAPPPHFHLYFATDIPNPLPEAGFAAMGFGPSAAAVNPLAYGTDPLDIVYAGDEYVEPDGSLGFGLAPFGLAPFGE